MEIGILNHAVDMARMQNIPVYWDINDFVNIYSNIGYHIKINLDPDSSINIGQVDKIKYYLITLLYNYTLLNSLEKLSFWKNLPDVIKNKIKSEFPIIDPMILGKQNFQVLNPYLNQHILEEIKLKSEQVMHVKFSRMYKCNKCGESKTHMRELQTRSGDEGGTLFISCIVCGSTWRDYG